MLCSCALRWTARGVAIVRCMEAAVHDGRPLHAVASVIVAVVADSHHSDRMHHRRHLHPGRGEHLARRRRAEGPTKNSLLLPLLIRAASCSVEFRFTVMRRWPVPPGTVALLITRCSGSLKKITRCSAWERLDDGHANN